MHMNANRPEHKGKIWNPAFTRVFLANMLINAGMQMNLTLVPKYVDSLGESATMVGLASSLFALTALLFKFISAPAIDTFDKRKVLTGGVIVMSVAFAGYAASESLTPLLVARLLQGIGQAFTTVCALTIAADALPSEKMGEGIGIFSLSQTICQAISPSIGLTLADWFDYRTAFIAGACMGLLAVAAAASIRTRFPSTKKFRISLRNMIAKEALVPAAMMLFLCMSYSVLKAFLVVYAEARGVTDGIGYFFTIYALTMLVTRPLVGRLSDRYGLVRVLIPAVLCFALSFFIISLSASLPMFFLAAFVSAFGYGACQPAVQTLCMKSVPQEKRGAGGCTNYIGTDTGILTGGILAGILVERFGYIFMWRMMLLPMLFTVAIVIIFRRRISGIEEDFSG